MDEHSKDLLIEELFKDAAFRELYDHKVDAENTLIDRFKDVGLTTDYIDNLIDAVRNYDRYVYNFQLHRMNLTSPI